MGIEIMKHAFKLLWMVMHLIEKVITYIVKSLKVLAMHFNLMYHSINHLVPVMITKCLKIQNGVIRNHKSEKDKQYNGQHKKGQNVEHLSPKHYTEN